MHGSHTDLLLQLSFPLVQEAEQAFSARSKSLFTNAPNPRKQWSTVKIEVFGASSSLPPLVDRGVRLVWSADEKASLFSAHLDAKQYRNSFQQPHSCDSSPVMCSIAFRLSFVLSLFQIWNLMAEMLLMECAHFFYKQVALELAHKLAVSFRHLDKGGCFPTCGRLTNAVPVPKESSSSHFGDHRPISITPVLSRVKKYRGWKVDSFLEDNSLLPLFNFRIEGAWEHGMLCSHCLTVYMLL